MPTKLTILTQLSRGELWWIIDRYELPVGDRRKLDELYDAIRRLPKSTLGDILLSMDRVRLKEICRGLNLDDGGKLKNEIVARLIGGNGGVDSDESDDDAEDSRTSSASAESALLDHLTRNELLQVAERHHLTPSDRRKRESALAAVSRISSPMLGAVLLDFSRDRLKDLCAARGLDDTGKSKRTLVQRLLGGPVEPDDSDEQNDGDAGRDGDDEEESRVKSSSIGTSHKGEQPRLFIGSSVESLKIAKRIQVELDFDFDVTIWHQSLFAAGAETWRQLVNIARNDFDFALFVFGPDDAIESRKEAAFSPRDNVLLEYGLFVGAIGPERTFFLYNRSHKPKIASDLAGITALTYRDRDNLQAALGPACTQLHDICERLGRRSVSL